MQFSYDVISSRALNSEFFTTYGINPDSYLSFSDGSGYLVFATDQVANRLKTSPIITQVTKRIQPKGGEDRIFPNGILLNWNRDNYGPLKIPAQGWTIPMNEANMVKYFSTIKNYENHENVEIKGGELFIDGLKINEYTFKQDYYFMMGDNRHDSLDSRYWGFVPEDHIVGKAWFLWLSLDKFESLFNKIRWSRFLKKIE